MTKTYLSEKYIAVYRGDTLLCHGWFDEVRKKLGMTKDALAQYLYPNYKKRKQKTENHLTVIEVKD